MEFTATSAIIIDIYPVSHPHTAIVHKKKTIHYSKHDAEIDPGSLRLLESAE